MNLLVCLLPFCCTNHVIATYFQVVLSLSDRIFTVKSCILENLCVFTTAKNSPGEFPGFCFCGRATNTFVSSAIYRRIFFWCGFLSPRLLLFNFCSGSSFWKIFLSVFIEAVSVTETRSTYITARCQTPSILLLSWFIFPARDRIFF